MRKKLMVLLIAAASLSGAQETPDIAQITQGMQQRYESIDNAVARYTQHIKLGFTKIEQAFDGTLTMKKPRKYRVEAEHQTIVTDGATVWAFSTANKQVVIDRYKENQNSISPDQFLLNLPSSYYASVLGTEKGAAGQLVTMKLVPKDDRSFVRSVKLWVEVDSWVVKKIQLIDVNDTENLYTINDIKLNSKLNDALFSFTPPPGTEVVDLR